MEDFFMIAAVSLVVGFAGFVDSIAGGGGVISLPAYFLTGMPAHMCYGTNKFASSCGTTFAVATYMKNGAVNLKVALIAAVGSFAGSTAGSKLVLMLDEWTLHMMLIVLLPVMAVFMLVKKPGGDVDESAKLGRKKMAALALAVGLAVGCYDGAFGPGTGTIAALAFTALMKFDLRTASGNAKVMNLASNYAALITFLMAGMVDYRLGIPSAICNIVGGIAGSRMAVKRGATFIRPVMLVVMVLLIAYVAYDMLKG